MKWCSMLLAIRKMQIKTTITFTRTAKIKDNKCWQVCTGTGTVTRAGGKVQCAATPETVGQALKQLSLLQDPAIPVQGIHARNENRCPHENLYLSVHSRYKCPQPWWPKRGKIPNAHQVVTNKPRRNHSAVSFGNGNEALIQGTIWWTLRTLREAKEASLRRPHVIGFYLRETSVIDKAMEKDGGEGSCFQKKGERGVTANGGSFSWGRVVWNALKLLVMAA